jgi:hypothetical protein
MVSNCRSCSLPPPRARCAPRQQLALDYQPFPQRGPLFKQANLPLTALRTAVGTQTATIYAYVVTSVEHREGHLVQTGSGPNWQGGTLTLCTCKHRLRNYLPLEEWPGVWLAGFTSTTEMNGRNALVFLTRIAAAYPSQASL